MSNRLREIENQGVYLGVALLRSRCSSDTGGGTHRRRGIAIRLAVLLLAFLSVSVGTAGFWRHRKEVIRLNYERLRAEGLHEASAGDFPDALQHLTTYLQRYPYDVDALAAYVRVRPQVKEDSGGEIGDTIRGLRALLRIDPDRDDAQHQILDLYMKRDYFAEAADVANSILQRHPDDLDALKAKTLSLIKLGESEEALGAAQKWYTLAPLDLESQIAVLSLMQDTGSSGDDIVKMAMDNLKDHPNDPRFELAEVYAFIANKDPDSAKDAIGTILGQPIPNDYYFTKILMGEMDALGMQEQMLTLLQSLANRSDDPLLSHNDDPAAISSDDPEKYLLLLVHRLWEEYRFKDLLDVLNGPGAKAIISDPEILAIKALCLTQLNRTAEADAIRQQIASMAAKDHVAAAWMVKLANDNSVAPAQFFDICQAAVEERPNDNLVREFLGEAYTELGENDQAIDVWLSVARGEPAWDLPVIQLANVMIDIGRYDSAIAMTQEAIRRSPKSATVAITTARVQYACMEVGRFNDTKALLDYVTKIQSQIPGEPESLAIQIDLLSRQNSQEAAKALDNALATTPKMPESLLLRLAAISRANKLDREEACFDRCLKDYGASASLAYARAVDCYAAGNPAAGALLLSAEQKKADPTNQSLDWQIAVAQYADASGDSSALNDLIKLGDANPGNLRVQRLALNSNSVRQAGASDFAERTITRMQNLVGKENIEVHLGQARWDLDFSADEDQSAAEDAVTHLRKALLDSPDSIEVRMQLARAYARLDRLPEAIEQATVATEINPNATSIELYLADLLSQHGDFDRAKEHLDHIAASGLPSLSIDQRRKAALLAEQQGESQLAISLLDQADPPEDAGDHDDLIRLSLYRQQNDKNKVEETCQRLLKKPSPDSIFAVADAYASLGQIDNAQHALELLDQIKPPLSPGVRELIRGRYAASQGDALTALAYYQLATRVAPNNATTWRVLAVFDLTLGKGDDAAATVREGLHQNPGDGDLEAMDSFAEQLKTAVNEKDGGLKPLAVAFATADHTGNDQSVANAARDTLTQILNDQANLTNQNSVDTRKGIVKDLLQLSDSKYPRFGPLLIYVATLQQQLGDTDAAASTAERAASVAPNWYEPYQLLVSIYTQSQRWQDVIDSADKWNSVALVKSIDPDIAKATALLQLNRPNDAEQVLAPYIKQSPDALNLFGQAETKLGKTTELASLLEPLLSQGERGQKVWMYFAAHYLPYEDAEAWLLRAEKIVVVEPGESTDVKIFLAQMWEALYQNYNAKPDAVSTCLKHAQTIIDALVSQPDPSAEVFTAVGIQCEVAGDPIGAEAAYRHSLQLNPDLPVTLNNLAMILAKKGGDQNLNEASKLIENALAILPDNPALYDTSASIDEGKHQYASAVTHMTEAVNREPGKPSYIVHLARCLFESQNTQEAADELDKFDSINQEQPNSISPDLLQQAAVLRSKLPSSPHAS